jgi:hypothetical protein
VVYPARINNPGRATSLFVFLAREDARGLGAQPADEADETRSLVAKRIDVAARADLLRDPARLADGRAPQRAAEGSAA